MAIKVSQAFERTSANPIDASLALTKAQMLTVNDNLMPAYYFTICQDDGFVYLYDKSATASPTTGKFTKFEGGGGSSIQVTTLPTAAAAELGNIYQYVGTTTASYTNGYFYKCVSDGAVTPTYSWTQLNVQPSSGSGGGSGVIVNATLLASGWDANNRQTLTFADYDADMGGVIGVPTNATAAQKAAYAESIINVYSQSGNQFTFEAETVPAVDLPVTLYAGGGSGGSGSGGHTIENDAGTALTQRDNLQFKNATVTDNGTDTTVVETEKIQYTTMPTASASNVGQIAQYIGTTTASLVKGLFYEVVEDTSTTPSTYAWVETTVQEHPDVDLTNVFASGMPVASVSGDRRFNYQTDEHEVGTWIDGSVVYQRVLQGTTPQEGIIDISTLVAGGIPNADNARIVEAFVTYTISNGTWNCPLPNGFNSSTICGINIAKDASKMYFNLGLTEARNAPFTVVIQYTKTE